MRALGMPARLLVGLLLVELVLLALVAGVLGVMLGYLMATALLPDVAATLRGLYGASVPGVLSLRPDWWASGLAIAVAGTLAAAGQSLWRMLNLPVLDGARPRAWARASEATVRWQAAAGVVLLLAGLTIERAATGLLAGFAILGALLLGAALILPLFLSAAVSLCRRLARGPVSEWFWADTRQQLPGLSVALMALLLALAANIGVGAMVSSFRLTFTGYLDQRLAAELYVRGESNEEARAMAEWFAPRVDAVLPLWRLPAELAGHPGDVVGAADHATFRDNWPMLSGERDAWDRVARGEAVLINEQLARRTGLGIGDTVELPGGWTPSIAGIYSDYGNPASQAIAGLAAMQSRYPDADHSQLGVRVAPGSVAQVRAEFEKAFGGGEQRIIDQAGLKRFSMQVFERTFVVTGVLNVLTLAVAGFALFASLMTLSAMRLPQVAPVWAVGVPRASLARMELLRTLALAAFAMMFAGPVGLALAWVLLAVVNVEAFGWKLPLYLFPLDWLTLGAMALGAAALAAWWPVRRLARTPPAELLKVFAHER
jgi:putative ABC transport system permease protein